MFYSSELSRGLKVRLIVLRPAQNLPAIAALIPETSGDEPYNWYLIAEAHLESCGAGEAS